MRLRDKVAIVTGSSRGIGRGIALRFAQEGARLVLNSRNRDSIEQVAEECCKLGVACVAVVADVGHADDVNRLFRETLNAFGTVDVLVNNAGWANPEKHFLEMDEAHWHEVQRTNLDSVFLCTSRAAQIMVDQKKPGSIVSVSSCSSVRAHRSQAAYDATKGAIEAFTRAVAIDLAPFRVRCNVMAPGAVHTEDYDTFGSQSQAERAKTIPLRRVGFPEDCAGAVAFLASDDADWITGQVIYVDGGMLAQLRSPQVDRTLPPAVAARLWSEPDQPRPIRSWG